MGTNVFEERSRRTEMSPALGSAEPLCCYTGSAARAAPGARSHPLGRCSAPAPGRAVIGALCSAPCPAGRLLYGQIQHCPGRLAEGSSELSQRDISKGKEMGLEAGWLQSNGEGMHRAAPRPTTNLCPGDENLLRSPQKTNAGSSLLSINLSPSWEIAPQ